MEIITTAAGWLVLLHWIHLLAGIVWIGMLYYFNFVQTPFFATVDATVRSGMIRGLVPNALWWFRWGAMLSFLSGWTIVLITFPGGAAPGYLSLVLTGGLMGTFMWANVWFVIWPAQRVVIASAEQVASGSEPIPNAALRAQNAGLASRTNTLFSIPVLFFMSSAGNLQSVHSVDSSYGVYALLAGLLILLVELNSLAGPGLLTQRPLGSVSGTIFSGFALTVALYLFASWLL